MKNKFKVLEPKTFIEYKMPFAKRIFDILISTIIILLLSPLLILAMILIKLESRGPIFYISKRIGTGYNMFSSYKLRSMYVIYKQKNILENTSAFFKIVNDPRITKMGYLIRFVQLDRIPLFFNVIKGDLSIVGNRPLPLYEAEKLTNDQWGLRFLAPSGITGLWKISKYNPQIISKKEQRILDNNYALNASPWNDFRLIIQSISCIFKKEKSF